MPRWLFALQSWEFPPTITTLFSPYLWYLWFKVEILRGCKARWPALSLGSSTK